MAAKQVIAFLALLTPAVAFAQSSALPVCNQGMPCIQDSKGVFVGVGNGLGAQSGVYTHVFDGVQVAFGANYFGLEKGLGLLFASNDCSGTPLMLDDSAIPFAAIDTDGTIYRPVRPHPSGLKVGSAVSVDTGACITQNPYSGADLTVAVVLNRTFVKSLTPPFVQYSRGRSPE